MTDWIDDWADADYEDPAVYVQLLRNLRAAHSAHCPHKAEAERLKALCGEAAEKWRVYLCICEDKPHAPGETCKDCDMYHKLRAASEGKEVKP